MITNLKFNTLANQEDHKSDHFPTENPHVYNLTESSLQTSQGFLCSLHREDSDTYFLSIFSSGDSRHPPLLFPSLLEQKCTRDFCLGKTIAQ